MPPTGRDSSADEHWADLQLGLAQGQARHIAVTQPPQQRQALQQVLLGLRQAAFCIADHRQGMKSAAGCSQQPSARLSGSATRACYLPHPAWPFSVSSQTGSSKQWREILQLTCPSGIRSAKHPVISAKAASLSARGSEAACAACAWSLLPLSLRSRRWPCTTCACRTWFGYYGFKMMVQAAVHCMPPSECSPSVIALEL